MADPPTADPNPPRPSLSLSDIRDALGVHYTDRIRLKAERYARHRAWMVRRAGQPVPGLTAYAKELVHDAMSSIWMGARSWDPRTPLLARLCFIVQDRTWHEVKHAQRHQRLSFDVAANDSGFDDNDLGAEERAFLSARDRGVVDLDRALAAGSRIDYSPLQVATLARQVIDALAPLGRDDRAVRAIVSAWEHGFVDCDDVLAFTGLSESAYRAALKRIRRLARRLPPDLREAALDLLRSAS
ncbi:MAG: hypothetical protein F9K40_10250 [Kofleriaceae bacterium]|nr:MAG: hypothetical protein F9K40_10250 [Kofleriaceae bacterium]